MKHLIIISLFVAIVVVGISFLVAHKEEIDPFSIAEPAESPLRFIKNEGQWEQDFDYLVRLNGGDLRVSDNSLIYSFYELPKNAHPSDHRIFGANVLNNPGEKVIKGHVLKVDFLGAKPQVDIQPGKKYKAYHNYFLGSDESRWKGNVPLYGELRHRDLYPGIDMRMYGSAENFKYDLIVAPHGDPAQISIRYSGADQLYIKDRKLFVKTSVREIVEEEPVVYQKINGKLQEVVCAYVLHDTVVTFSFPNGYNPNYELVIDPTLEFSTYTGSTADNWGFTATYDLNGSLYAGGIIFAPGGVNTSYPVVSGSFQTNYGGGESECTITKFSPDGTSMVYSTYLGGSLLDQPQSLIVNDLGELYVYGRTSSTDFPTTVSGYDSTYNGGRFDIFVSKFNAAGTQLLGSTYLGGGDSDGENGNHFTSGGSQIELQANYGDDARGEILLDDQSNCYIAGCTRSTNFPTTAGALQATNSGQQDGIVVKLNPNLTGLLFSTYLGGSDNDAAYGMALDSSNNVYVTGGTESNNFPTTPGTVNPTYLGGSTDGFITKLSANGSLLIRSTFMGTSAKDQSYFLDIDKDLNIYVTGQSTGNFPVIGNVYANPGSKQFIAKLDGNLNAFIYSTVFGSGTAQAPNISPTAFLVDRCQNVYVAGWGGTTNYGGNTQNMPTTTNALQLNTDGSDFYLIVLNTDAQSLMYGTYFGGNNTLGSGEHLDGGTCRFDKNGVLYHAVCAGCGGFSTFPTTPGVVSRTNNSQNCNLAAFKIDFNLASDTLIESACGEYTSPSGKYTWTTSGIYQDTITSAICPKWVAINLTIPVIDTGVTQGSTNLTANAAGLSYQWLDCNNNYSPIPSATQQSFSPLSNGLYAVAIKDNTCSDTSACYAVGNVGISHEDGESDIKIYPNPTSGIFRIDFEKPSAEFLVRIYDLHGKQVYQNDVIQKNSVEIDLTNKPKGVYLVRVNSKGQQKTSMILVK